MPNPGYTKIEDTILEKTTPTLTAIMKDSSGAVIPGTALSALNLTYYLLNDGPTYTIINSRNNQDVLTPSASGAVTVDNAGNLKWVLQEADTAILTDTNKSEIHRAVFKFTYTSADGVKIGKYMIDFIITNTEIVT